MEITGLEAGLEGAELAGTDAGPVVVGGERVVQVVEAGGDRDVTGPVGAPVLFGGTTVVV